MRAIHKLLTLLILTAALLPACARPLLAGEEATLQLHRQCQLTSGLMMVDQEEVEDPSAYPEPGTATVWRSAEDAARASLPCSIEDIDWRAESVVVLYQMHDYMTSTSWESIVDDGATLTLSGHSTAACIGAMPPPSHLEALVWRVPRTEARDVEVDLEWIEPDPSCYMVP